MARLIVLLLFFVTITSSAYAQWTGPIEVVTGQWGMNSDQFGLSGGGIYGKFPTNFGVDSLGNIFVGDPIQNKIKIFSPKGLLKKEINSPIDRMLWPASLIVGRSCAVVGYTDITHVFDIKNGTLISTLENMGGAQYVNDDCSEIITRTSTTSGTIWRTYTPTGQVLSENTLKPLVIGRKESKKIRDNQYEISVSFPGRQWKSIQSQKHVNPFLDANGNLYFISNSKIVAEINNRGKEVASIAIPKNNIEQISRGEGIEPKVVYHKVYGQALIAPSGNVYTWKRTPNSYSIIKWIKN